MQQIGDGKKNSHGSLVIFPCVEFISHKLSIPQAVGEDKLNTCWRGTDCCSNYHAWNTVKCHWHDFELFPSSLQIKYTLQCWESTLLSNHVLYFICSGDGHCSKLCQWCFSKEVCSHEHLTRCSKCRWNLRSPRILSVTVPVCMKVFPLSADEQIAWFTQIQTEGGFLLVIKQSYLFRICGSWSCTFMKELFWQSFCIMVISMIFMHYYPHCALCSIMDASKQETFLRISECWKSYSIII